MPPPAPACLANAPCPSPPPGTAGYRVRTIVTLPNLREARLFPAIRGAITCTYPWKPETASPWPGGPLALDEAPRRAD